MADLLVVSGPSGSGKRTLIDHLLGAIPELLPMVTYTTRSPRPGEQEGRDYRYVDDEAFDALLREGAIGEVSAPYGDHRYGSPVELLSDSEPRPLLAEMDQYGFLHLREVSQRIVKGIFILPPTSEDLAARIQARSPEQNLQARLDVVDQQLQAAKHYDYQVENHQLQQFLFDGLAAARACLS